MTTATQAQLKRLLGERGEEPAPANKENHSYVVRCGAYAMTASSDDLYHAIEQALEGYRMSEQLSEIWDYRGDSAAYDPEATPILLAVVGLIWNRDEV